MPINIKRTEGPKRFPIPASEVPEATIKLVDELCSSVGAKPTNMVKIQVQGDTILDPGLADFAVAIDCTERLATGVENLKWLANKMQKVARKGMIVTFKKHTMEEITEAFCQKPKGENVVPHPSGEGFVALFHL